MLFNESDFIVKPIEVNSEGKTQHEMDIGIKRCKDGEFNFSIRPTGIDKILIHSRKKDQVKRYEFLMLAFKDNKLYFKGTNQKNAFLVTENKLSQNLYCRINEKYLPEDLEEWLSLNQGKHDLLYDKESRLYYIEGTAIEFILRG